MIAEILLITELLRQTVGTPISTSKAPSPTKWGRATVPKIQIPDIVTEFVTPVPAPLVVSVTQEQVAAFKESERVKQALRGL